jgi:hypothetical protein
MPAVAITAAMSSSRVTSQGRTSGSFNDDASSLAFSSTAHPDK